MTVLADIEVALTVIAESDLRGLLTAIEVPEFVPGLTAWLEGAAEWEISRRNGIDYELLVPLAGIPDEEVMRSLVILAVLAAKFRGDDPAGSAPMVDFLALVGGVLRVEFERLGRPP